MTFSSPGFGVYVHWPFCKAKCPYCDFNSHVRHGQVDALGFAASLAAEIAWFRRETGPREVTSIFFGGGTPSLMPAAAVARVLDAVAAAWHISPSVEVTLESNPTSAEAKHFAGYRAAGINRVSVGVQALDDSDLKALGRQHTADEALAAFRMAARIFPRVSFDMIYARPGQTPSAWRHELSRALAEQRGHMSLYQLTIEPETAFQALHAAGSLHIPDEGAAAELLDITRELTEAAGLNAYEVSNHAAPGEESRHNLLYWRYGEYAGVGPGAHSRIAAGPMRRALTMEKHPETWRALVSEQGSGVVTDEVVGPGQQALEYLLMGLRLTEGIDTSRYASLRGEPISAAAVTELSQLGLIGTAGDRLWATTKGRHLLNAVIAHLAP